MHVAIHLAATNTDAVARGEELRFWTVPSQGRPSVDRIREVLAAVDLSIDDVEAFAVTGGNHSALPAAIGGRAVLRIGEMAAIGRGGLALAGLEAAAVVSAGSGTAVVGATPERCWHITGTGVGGGTLLGLGRMLLGNADPRDLDRLARAGRHAGVNLTIADIIGGEIAGLPADTTAVNFGKMATSLEQPSAEDIAAGLVNLVGQVIGVVAISAARSAAFEQIIVVGHVVDLESVRATIAEVGDFYHAPIRFAPQPGYATVLGALLEAEKQV